MLKDKKKKDKPSKNENEKSYDFSKAHEYFRSSFGLLHENIDLHVLNIKVSDLLEDFKIFEDLNNVQNWPISTLIQRELDHKRASMICKDYLLNDNNSKYFPPLIAVLIPTGDNYIPLDSFPKASKNEDNEELNKLKVKYIKGVDSYKDYEEPVALSSGISIIPFFKDCSHGDIVWDKNTVSAVIIDGQHRYKALEKAKNEDKSFSNCKVTVTLVDLTKICEKKQCKPTDLARDLFVTINNTPIEVDETRLVLMDDKDVLSTFTQVLIDDCDDKHPSAIPPELIDWECEGGKHNNANSLSGVLVLRQIILTAFFDNSKISVVEDRMKVKNVIKWKNKIDLWLSPDKEIAEQLSEKETISCKYKQAEEKARNNNDDDDEDSLFLFSYNISVSKIIKDKFKKLFLPTFKEVFLKLAPFDSIFSIANDYGVLEKGTLINSYYRSFKGKRSEMKKNDPEIKECIKKYESQFSKLTEQSIFFTVMGQKSIFKALFDGFLSDAENKTADDYKEKASYFIKNFNQAYNTLCPSNNADEYFFSAKYKTKTNKQDFKGILHLFWKGIILKDNEEIDYSQQAISIFSEIIQDIIFFLEKENDATEFKFKSYDKIVIKHEKIIKKLDYEKEKTDEERNDLAKKYVNIKQKKLNELLRK